MEREAAVKLIQQLLSLMKQRGGSDLFLYCGFPPAIKLDGQLTPVMEKPLSPENSAMLIRALMNDRQVKEFEATNECNFAISPPGIGRFRVNAFVQQGRVGGVLRTIETTIPDFDKLGLPPVLREVVMTKRGLVLMVGGTGSGKSTSLAAMIGYRNQNSKGHIITIEDPVEYVHPHIGCLITQREVGSDTHSWEAALKNTLREAPDVILIGEVRVRETMDAVIQLANTGHLAISTLHANNANQALQRIVNLYPDELRDQLYMDLSMTLRAIVSQRLVRRKDGRRCAAVEVMVNTPYIQDLILNRRIDEVKEAMASSSDRGMLTFDTSLYRLYKDGLIDLDEALNNADSRTNLEAKINFGV